MGVSFKNDKSVAIVLDFNNQVWRSYHATKNENITNSDGINVGCVIGLMKIIRFAIKKVSSLGDSHELVICEDRYAMRKQKLYQKNQKAFKDYEGHISYKGSRKKEDIGYNPVEICSQFINCLPLTRIFLEGEEADDVISSFIEKNKNRPVHLYTSDKDMWQLLPHYPNLKIFTSEDEQPNEEKCLKHFDHSDFKKVLLYKIIRGDSGDNVKSVKNFQFKKAREAFDKCDGTIESFLWHMIQIFGEDHKYVDKLFDNAELLRLNYLVVKLRKHLKYKTEIKTKTDIDLWRKICAIYEVPSLFNFPLVKLT